MDFMTYLRSKKIDDQKFRSKEPELFRELREQYDQMHPGSFTAQKLFLINPIRRKYQLNEKSADELTKPKVAMRPKFKKP